MAAEDVLLPKTVVPSKYDVTLTPDLVRCTFSGSLQVDLEVVSTTSSIVCNAHQLAVSNVSFVGSDGKALEAQTLAYDIRKQTLTATFGQALPQGKGSFKCNFIGTLNDELAGFYRSKYTIRGEQRWAAVTQFEATDCRRCFPCWDEPDM